jgi:hypothetical protein
MQVLVIVSSIFLLASIMMLILSTVPEFQVNDVSISDKNKTLFESWTVLLPDLNCPNGEWLVNSS